MLKMHIVTPVIASEAPAICCLCTTVDRLISVMGNINCKNPVSESGMFFAEWDSKSRGTMVTPPASQMSLFAWVESPEG